MAKRRKELVNAHAVEVTYGDGSRFLVSGWPMPRKQARDLKCEMPESWNPRVVKVTGTLYVEPAR